MNHKARGTTIGTTFAFEDTYSTTTEAFPTVLILEILEAMQIGASNMLTYTRTLKI